MAIAYSGYPTRDRAIVPTTYPRTTMPIRPPTAPQPMGTAPVAPRPPTPVAPTAPAPRPMAPAPTPGFTATPGATISEGFGLTPPAPMPGGLPRPQQPPPGGVTVPPPEGAAGGSDRFTTGFGPGNDIQFQQINPADSDRMKAYQDQLLSYSKGLAETPDRGELAKQAYSQIAAESEPDFQKAQQEIGQKAAALGRIGSGITTTELGDLGLQRAKYLGNVQKELATEAAGQSLADRIQRLQAGQGVEESQFGQEAAKRGELRGERGYEHEVAQEPFQQELQRRAIEDALQNSAFSRQLSAAQLGLTGAELYGQQAGEAGQTSSDLLNQLALEQYLKTQGGGGAPAAPSPFSFQPPEPNLPEQPLFPTRTYPRFTPARPTAPQFRVPAVAH